MNLLKDGYGLGALLHSSLAKQAKALYAVILSKYVSVTPQRHCGFIVPKFCKGAQALHLQGASVTATQTRLQSLYEGQTRQNKAAMPNMSGDSVRSRVMPLALISQVRSNLYSKLTGGNHHA